MSFSDISISEFTARLSTKAPVPGGGGASALVGALGSALGCMVGSLTVGKKKYAAVEDDIKSLMERSLTLQERLLTLIDKDAEAFEPLAKAYSLPSSTEEEKQEKAKVMPEVLKGACQVPIDIMECCCMALELIAEYAQKGSAIAISDAGVGAALCASALKGASLNVFINTKSMADRESAEAYNKKAFEMLDKYVPMAEEIFSGVQKRLVK